MDGSRHRQQQRQQRKQEPGRRHPHCHGATARKLLVPLADQMKLAAGLTKAKTC
jgi:hypothetical protein